MSNQIPTTVDRSLTVTAHHLVWNAEGNSADQLIEFGLIREVDTLALSAQLINKLGEFKYHILEDKFKLADPSTGALSRELNFLSKVDYADLDLTENLMTLIRTLQPIERAINANLDKNKILELIQESIAQIDAIDIGNYAHLTSFSGMADYLQKQKDYLKKQVLDLQSVLNKKIPTSFELQNWLRARYAKIVNDAKSSEECLVVTEKFRPSNVFGMRAGRLNTTILETANVLSNYQFDQSNSVTYENQGLYSKVNGNVLDSRLFKDVNIYKLLEATIYIEKKGEIDATDVSRLKSTRKNLHGSHLDISTRMEEEGKVVAVGSTILDFIKNIGLKVVSFFTHLPGTIRNSGRYLVQSTREAVRDYFQIAPNEVNSKTFLDKLNLEKQALEQRKTEMPPAAGGEQQMKIAPAASEVAIPGLSQEENTGLMLLNKILMQVMTEGKMDEKSLQELLKIEFNEGRNKQTKELIELLKKIKTEQGITKGEKSLIRPGTHLGVLDEGDAFTSLAKFINSFSGYFYNYSEQHPYSFTAFVGLYSLMLGMVVAPHATYAVLSKLGFSNRASDAFYYLAHSTAHALTGSESVLNQAVTSASTWAQVASLVTDVLGNGGTSSLLQPIIEEIKSAQKEGQFATTLKALQFIGKSVFLLGLGAGALFGVGTAALQIPLFKDEAGFAWEGDSFIFGGKFLGLGIEMIEAKNTIPTDLKAKGVSDDDAKLINVASFYQSVYQQALHEEGKEEAIRKHNADAVYTHFFGWDDKIKEELQTKMEALEKKYGITEAIKEEDKKLKNEFSEKFNDLRRTYEIKKAQAIEKNDHSAQTAEDKTFSENVEKLNKEYKPQLQALAINSPDFEKAKRNLERVYFRKNRAEFDKTIRDLSDKYHLGNRLDLRIFGKPKQPALIKLLMGFVKPVGLIVGALFSPLAGLYSAYKAKPGERWEAFKGVVKRAWGRLGGWVGNIARHVLEGLGKAVKMLPRWGVNLIARVLAIGASYLGRFVKWVAEQRVVLANQFTTWRNKSRAKEVPLRKLPTFDDQYIARQIIQAKSALLHFFDKLARKVKDITLRAFDRLYHSRMTSAYAKAPDQPPASSMPSSSHVGVMNAAAAAGCEVNHQSAPTAAAAAGGASENAALISQFEKLYEQRHSLNYDTNSDPRFLSKEESTIIKNALLTKVSQEQCDAFIEATKAYQPSHIFEKVDAILKASDPARTLLGLVEGARRAEEIAMQVQSHRQSHR